MNIYVEVVCDHCKNSERRNVAIANLQKYQEIKEEFIKKGWKISMDVNRCPRCVSGLKSWALTKE